VRRECMQCSCAPSRRSSIVVVVEDWRFVLSGGQRQTGGPGYQGGGEAREAKRGVILSAPLVPWEVGKGRLLLPSRVVVSRAHVSGEKRQAMKIRAKQR
jgi:hypothetical protein